MRQLGAAPPGGAESLAIFHQLIFDERLTGSIADPLARVSVDEIGWAAVRASAAHLFTQHIAAARVEAPPTLVCRTGSNPTRARRSRCWAGRYRRAFPVQPSVGTGGRRARPSSSSKAACHRSEQVPLNTFSSSAPISSPRRKGYEPSAWEGLAQTYPTGVRRPRRLLVCGRWRHPVSPIAGTVSLRGIRHCQC